MPARNRPGLSENTRKRIQTTMLVKRLEEHILGDVELSATQVRGIEVLLKKTLPDLSAIHSTSDEEAQTLDEWLNELPDPESTSSEE